MSYATAVSGLEEHDLGELGLQHRPAHAEQLAEGAAQLRRTGSAA